jgi:hypothetical protein
MDDEEVSSENISQHYADIVKVRRSVTFRPRTFFGIWIKIFLRGRSCSNLYIFTPAFVLLCVQKNSRILFGKFLFVTM